MIDDLMLSLRTRIAAVWPETVTGGKLIYEADHIDLIPWEDLTPPYPVIGIDRLPKQTGYGAGNQAYLPAVHIYYVAEVHGPLSGIRAKLEALDDDLMQTALSAGQVQAVTELNWSQELLANQIFAGKGMAHRAGRLEVNILIGRILGT